MSCRKLVSCLVLEVVGGGEIVWVYIVVFSEFEEGHSVFITVDPGIYSLYWRRMVIFFSSSLFLLS